MSENATNASANALPTPGRGPDALPPDWRSALTRDELDELLRLNVWRGWLSIGLDWGLVALAMALVAAFPNPFTLLLALCVIGARQLGMAVMMHEAAHRTLFRSRRLNDFAGNWLCAYPIWADLRPYRPYHLKHHAKNWTDEDPDLDLATKFPVERRSMWRKVWRDLSGQVAWKRVRAVLRRDLGLGQVPVDADHVSFGKTAQATSGKPQASGKTARRSHDGWRNLRGVIVTNAVLLGILALLGRPELYLLWVGAWFTTYSLVTRIRSIGEHNMVSDPADERQNSRTTLASWWERLLIAPNRVNYHLEHHLLMTVPFYNLPRLHRLLAERGVLDGANVEHGYLRLLRRAASRAPAPATLPA